MSVIPGLENVFQNVREVVSGGSPGSWMEYTTVKRFTDAFIFHDKKILLGYKKRGIGMHKFNGFGGKVEPGETSFEAAARELEEEAGIKCSLKHIGVLFFRFDDQDCGCYNDIYRADGFEGTVTETDEMLPEWFSIAEDASDLAPGDPTRPLSSIPSDQLWATDPYWFPMLLSNKPFLGRADYKMDPEKGKLRLHKWWFGVLGEDLKCIESK